MIHPQAFIKMFGYNASLIHKQVARLQHIDSLKQPDNLPNSLNWLVGHIISARTRVLDLVNEAPVWTDDVRVRYRSGSESIREDGDGVLLFEQLLKDFDETQERLVKGLSSITLEELSQLSGFEDNTNADSMAYFYFHEVYHIGQIADVATALGNESMWV